MKKLLAILLCLSFIIPVAASSGSVSVSVTDSTTVGSTISLKITIKCSNKIGGAKMYLTYDKDYLKLSSHNAGNNFNSSNGALMFEMSNSTSASYTFKFVAQKQGSTTVKVSTREFIDYDGDDVSGFSETITKKIKIEAKTGNNDKPVSLSADNSLSELRIEGYEFDKPFEGDVFEYVCYADTTNLKITAKASSSKAKISYITTEFKEGWQRATVIVQAENKAQQSYNIKLYITEKPTKFFNVNGKSLGVVKNIDKVDKEGWVKTEKDGLPVFEYKGVDLIYLIDEEGKAGFYLYENGKVFDTTPLIIGDHLYFARDFDYANYEVPNAQFTSFLIDNDLVKGWEFIDEKLKDFKVAVLTDENGREGLFTYDTVQKTIQRYMEPNAKIVIQEVEVLGWMFYVGCGALVISLMIAFIGITALRRYNRAAHPEKYVENEEEDDYDDEE